MIGQKKAGKHEREIHEFGIRSEKVQHMCNLVSFYKEYWLSIFKEIIREKLPGSQVNSNEKMKRNLHLLFL